MPNVLRKDIVPQVHPQFSHTVAGADQPRINKEKARRI